MHVLTFIQSMYMYVLVCMPSCVTTNINAYITHFIPELKMCYYGLDLSDAVSAIWERTACCDWPPVRPCRRPWCSWTNRKRKSHCSSVTACEVTKRDNRWVSPQSLGSVVQVGQHCVIPWKYYFHPAGQGLYIFLPFTCHYLNCPTGTDVHCYCMFEVLALSKGHVAMGPSSMSSYLVQVR